jgi:Phe-tRNA synthetase beta subunit B1 domain
MEVAEKKFDELCFEYGIELDDVVRLSCARACFVQEPRARARPCVIFCSG